VSDKSHRPRGRQAEAARNDERLLEAAREIVATEGIDAPVAAIAARAGVGIGSLYRRYGSKVEMLQRLCVVAMEQAIAAAEDALADADPWRGLTRYVQTCVAFHSGALAPLAGHIPTTATMNETAAHSFDLLGALVGRAPLRPDVSSVDVARLVELFARTRPRDAAVQDVTAHDRLLTIALDGLRTREPTKLPGRKQRRKDYVRRWQQHPPAPTESAAR
jgi:AcrR family transcriptional regulator